MEYIALPGGLVGLRAGFVGGPAEEAGDAV